MQNSEWKFQETFEFLIRNSEFLIQAAFFSSLLGAPSTHPLAEPAPSVATIRGPIEYEQVPARVAVSVWPATVKVPLRRPPVLAVTLAEMVAVAAPIRSARNGHPGFIRHRRPHASVGGRHRYRGRSLPAAPMDWLPRLTE